MRILNLSGKALFWLLSISIALASWRFMVGGVAETMDIVAHNLDTRKIPLYAHLVFGPLALALLPFQFWGKLRTKRPAIHRWIGRVSVASIFVASIGAMIIAPHTTAGPVAAIGFFLLGLFWFATTAIAFYHVRAGRIAQHKRWMIRSASLTIAGIMLRLYLPIFMFGTNMEFMEFYPIVAWLCWVPNLLVAEWILRRPRTL